MMPLPYLHRLLRLKSLRSCRKVLRLPLWLTILSAPASALTGGPDASGYTYRDSSEPDGPAYEWIDISFSGEKIIGPGLGPSGSVLVKQVDLAPMHMMFGLAQSFVKVSRHGYLSNDGTDPGNDFTNDCPIDTPPSSGGGSRLAVFHDRFEGGIGSWGVYHRYFPVSPHPHYSGRVHVIQWDQVQLLDDTTDTPFSFQVLLFGNGDILYQYEDTPPAAASATVGTVFSSGPTRDGLGYSCNGGGISAGLAVLFEPPTVSLTSSSGLPAAIAAVPNGGKIVVDPAVTSIADGPFELQVNKVVAIDGGNGARIGGREQFRISGELVTLHKITTDSCRLDTASNLVLDDAQVASLELPAFTTAFAIGSTIVGDGIEVTGSSYFEARGCVLSASASGSASSLRLSDGASGALYETSVSGFKSPSIAGGTGVSGSALHLSDADLSCEDCVFPDNSGSGGTIASVISIEGDSAANFDRCWIYGHESNGRNIDIGDASGHSPVVEFGNCAIFGESFDIGGDADVAFDFCTLADGTNLVPVENAALHFRGCAIQDIAPIGLGTGFTVESLGYNVVSSDPQGHFSASTDLIQATAFLGPETTLASGLPIRLPLLVTGPLVDVVPASVPGIPDTDIRGVSRPQDATSDGIVQSDIGAFELEGGMVVDTFGTPGPNETSLLDAITLSPSGSTIYFDPSLSGETYLPPLLESIVIDKPLTLDASTLARPPVIGGGFQVESNVTLVMRNLSLSNRGSRLECREGSRLEAVDCIFDDNTSGALRGYQGASFDLTRCRFRGNGKLQTGTDAGGAILMAFDGSLVMRDCQFIGNEAYTGGAIHSSLFGTIEATRCLFAGNGRNDPSNGSLGGAISQPAGTYSTRFINCTFTENFANDGAVYLGDPGGGELRFSHCTIVRNFTLNSVGAIALDHEAQSPAVFDHSILAHNRTGTARRSIHYTGPALLSAGYNLEDGDESGFTHPTDLRNLDPLLGPLSDYGGTLRTITPLAGSPVIDAGDPEFDAFGLETDGRSLSRVVDGDDHPGARIDIGACEAGEVLRVESLEDEMDGGFPLSLREAITLGGEGDRILFDRSLNGGTISLAGAGAFNAPLGIDEDLTLDATNLPMGITLSGNGQVQVAKIWADSDVSAFGIEFVDGFITGNGGGIEVEGSLLLSHCTVADNEATGLGGGIYLDGGNLRGENLTIAENTATQAGGALADNPTSRSRLSLAFSTIKNNTAGTGTGGFRLGNSEADFRFCYVGNHTGGTGNTNGVTQPATTIANLGGNLEDRNDLGIATTSSANLPFFQQPGPLAANGGFVRTCAAVVATPTTFNLNEVKFFPEFDARGRSRSVEFPGGGVPESRYQQINAGAHQYQGDLGDFDLDGLPDWWEYRHGTRVDLADATADPDGDGRNNRNEFQALTLPRDPASALRVHHFERLPNDQALIVWSVVPGLTYEITGSTDLKVWKDSIGTATAEPGESVKQRGFRLPTPPGPRRFYRVEVSGAP